MLNQQIRKWKMRLYLTMRRLGKPFVTIYWLPFFIKYNRKKNVIFGESWMKYNAHHPIVNNWGDDINPIIIDNLTDKKLVTMPYDITLFRNTRYLLVGSIIGFNNLNNTIICGAGIKNPKSRLRGKPKQVLSVRGPRTREVLLKNDIACPEKYGDPALLFPLIYKPKCKKLYKYGFICNETTNINILEDIIKKLGLTKEQYIVISMTEYTNWTDVIDKVVSCNYIISESLHGLILPETYGIPCIWVEFMQHQDFWPFKFLDFYESIGKFNQESLKLFDDNYCDCDLLDKKLEEWVAAKIEYDKLLSYLPFSKQLTFEK